MPTPFYHLRIAEQLLEQPGLDNQTRQMMEQEWPAFLFGCTAPDVQTVSGQSRPATHFFDLPVTSASLPAWEAMLAAHPHLARSDHLPVEQSVFLAGYLCHLQADWLWIKDIYQPYFGAPFPGRPNRERFYLHNVLRAYLDMLILSDLHPQIADQLGRAVPAGWLPFVQDIFLEQWRDYLAGQLCVGCDVLTVEVFASRQGIPAEEYYRMLGSEEQLDRSLFTYLPRQSVQAYQELLLKENLLLVQGYLNENLYVGGRS